MIKSLLLTTTFFNQIYSTKGEMLYAAGDREKEKKKFYLDSDSFCQYLYFTSSKIFASEVACLSPLQR